MEPRHLIASALLVALASAPALAKKKKAEALPAPVQAISTDEISGPWAAAHGTSDRLHFVYTATAPEGEPRLLHRHGLDSGWTDPTEIGGSVPDALSLAVIGDEPVIVRTDPNGVHVITRAVDGWSERTVATADEGPGPQALTAHETEAHLLICLSPADGDSVLRRVVISPGRPDTVREISLRDGTFLHLAAAPAPNGWDHIAFTEVREGVRVLQEDDSGELATRDAIVLGYSRVRHEILIKIVLPSSGLIDSLRLVLHDGEPAAIWSAQLGGSKRIEFLASKRGRFVRPELLLETTSTVTSLAAAARDGTTLISALIDGILQSIRHDGSDWAVWLRPPGSDRHQLYVPLAMTTLLDRRGTGHLVTEEESRGPIHERRLVDWIAPSRIMRIEAPEIQEPFREP